MIYNFIIVEYKVITEYLNIQSEEGFFEKLWEWTYEDDLWDYIDDNDPGEEELIDYINNVFIEENVFHKYEDDEINCYAFKVDDFGEVTTYTWDQPLEDFIMQKVREYKGEK